MNPLTIFSPTPKLEQLLVFEPTLNHPHSNNSEYFYFSNSNSLILTSKNKAPLFESRQGIQTKIGVETECRHQSAADGCMSGFVEDAAWLKGK